MVMGWLIVMTPTVQALTSVRLYPVQVWLGRPARVTHPVSGVEKIKFVVILQLQTVVITMETQKLAGLMAVPIVKRQILAINKLDLLHKFNKNSKQEAESSFGSASLFHKYDFLLSIKGCELFLKYQDV